MGILIKANRTDVSKGNRKPADSQLCLYSWCNCTDLYQGRPTSPFKQRPMMAGQQEKKNKNPDFQKWAPNSSCSILVCTTFTMGWKFGGLMMKRDVSESLILPHGLINRKQAGGCEGFSIIITLKEMKTLQTLLLRGESRPCELTLILSGATTSSATKSMWNRWIVWPRVQYCSIYWLYITALLEDCINKQYKCVLRYPHKSHYFFLSYYVIEFMLNICTFFIFYSKHLLYFMKKSPI